MGFELGAGDLDRIKVGTVGRQEQVPRTAGLDGLLGGLALVGRQIVHDDDIAFLESRRELGFDIGLEDAPVHWGIDDERGGEPVAAQAGDEGLGHSMGERRLCAEPLALQAAAAQASHLGCGSGLVEKDEPVRLKSHVWLACGCPFFARRFDVWTILLGCQRCG
jgi:hypothetical protein